MGFKKENYTPKGLCLCICFLLVTNVHSILGQSHCPVRVDFEPREEFQTRSANQINEIKFPFFQRWEDLDNIRISDDERAFVELPKNKRSTVFQGQNLGFSLPNGAHISGIEIHVEGHTSGNGIVEGQMMKLINEHGDMVGQNLALDAFPIGLDWYNSNDSTDFKWRYGSSTDDWGLSLTEEMINSTAFGYALQVRNKHNQPVSVYIDNIQVIVYYTPLFEVCSTHACVPFYIDEVQDPLVTYEWYIPDGFELISTSEEDPVINIGASYAEFGEYEICVESFYKQASLGICCRKFNYLNCTPASISGALFFDKNNDSVNNSGDEKLEGIRVDIYDQDGFFVATTFSDQDGVYGFSNLDDGQYYIGVFNPGDSLVFTTPNIGSPDTDSDITGAFGGGTTNLLSVVAGDSLTHIDAGFNRALQLGDFIWEDLNGDGIQQEGEPGIFFAFITIYDELDSLVEGTASLTDGSYSFKGLHPGEYTIEVTSFIGLDQYISTIPNNSDSTTDSDLGPDNRVTVSYTEGGVIDSLDFGFYRPSTIGDFVWEDLNNNGIQDSDEPGLPDVTLTLLNANDEVIQTVISDSLGFYQFSDLAPGVYYIEIQTSENFLPTIFQYDNDPSNENDSDVFEQDEKYISPTITVISNSNHTDIDFGFAERPASLGGFTFLDANGNGQYDMNEDFVPNITVELYTSNGDLVANALTDEGGFYFFDEIIPNAYYLVFGITDDLLFTDPNIGDDLSDSDVDSTNGAGSTDQFTLDPDENNLSYSAGYQVKPKIGDFVWIDTNGNGLQDIGEIGLNDILVELYTDEDEFVTSMLSTSHPESFVPGYYIFTGLNPGNYYIKVPELEDYDFATIEVSDPNLNSDITNTNGLGTTDTFTVEGNDCKVDVDPGYALKKGSIAGEIWLDKDEDGIQDIDEELIGGIEISLHEADGTLVAFRNSNPEGQYIFPGLEAGTYFLIFSPDDQFGFTSPFVGTDATIDSDVNGENIAGSTNLITVNDGVNREHIDAGLIDGSVDIKGVAWIDKNGDGIQQDDESMLPNVKVDLYTTGDSLLGTQSTNAQGEYTFKDNVAGTYYLVFTPENTSYINTIANQGGDDNVDDDVTSFFQTGSTDSFFIEFFFESTPINAGYYTFSTIGDQVFIDGNDNGINDNEPGLNDVIVNLLNEDAQIIASDTTAQGGGLDSGYYQLHNVPPGTYSVQFIRPLFYQFITGDQGSDDNLDSDVVEISNNIGTTEEFSVMSGSIIENIDAGVVFRIPTESSISGSVWDDINTNGIEDADELPLASIDIHLENQDGALIASTTTDDAGVYLFDNLPEGFYIVKADLPEGKVATYSNVGSDDSIDSDFIDNNGMVATEPFFLATFEDLTDVDLGVLNELKVGDFVWEDQNNNGTQEAGEPGVELIQLTITNENGLIEESTFSDTDGIYSFEGLPAGRYKLCAELPSGFNFADSNIGSDLLDSDVDASGCTAFLDFTAGGIINDLDVGLTENGAIEGIAFIDLNGNGIQNLNDSGLDGVTVDLYSSNNELLESTLTSTINDISGIFKFSDLKATDYYLVFGYPEEYIITNPDVGDDANDSDITGTFGEGSTDLFSIPSGGLVTNIDGGAYLPASIGNQVWLDVNQNGLRENGEDGVEGIQVIIFRSFGVPFDTTVTDQEGMYQFQNLKQGLYFIQFVIPQEYTISPSDQGIDDDIDSDADNTGKTPLISLAHGADLESVDCGIFESMASLRSIVWNDLNGDGIRQNDEARIPGIKISLCDLDNNVLDSTLSNTLGLYAFQELPIGAYKILVDIAQTDYAFTSMNMDEDDMIDSDINDSGESEVFESMGNNAGLSVPNVDAGLLESGGIISVVWEDENANGVYDINEHSFSGIEVKLMTEEGKIYRELVSSNAADNIQFDHVLPGKYFMKYTVDKFHVNSPNSGELEVDHNNDVTQFEGSFITPVFEVRPNEILTNIDAGFYRGATLSSQVWYDNNKNGLQDDTGNLPYSVYATLFDSDGNAHGTRGTNSEGTINFYGIEKGSYYIQYYALNELFFTTKVENDLTNSDVDHTYGHGTTQMILFNPYEAFEHIDAGLISLDLATEDLSELATNGSESSARQGIDTNELSFDVHPNPAANYLKINVDRSLVDGLITIYNGQNQVVYKASAATIDQIDLTDLHPGIYLVKYELNGRSITKKILKIQ